MATQRGHAACVQALIQHPDTDVNKALVAAKEKGFEECVNILLQHPNIDTREVHAQRLTAWIAKELTCCCRQVWTATGSRRCALKRVGQVLIKCTNNIFEATSWLWLEYINWWQDANKMCSSMRLMDTSVSRKMVLFNSDSWLPSLKNSHPAAICIYSSHLDCLRSCTLNPGGATLQAHPPHSRQHFLLMYDAYDNKRWFSLKVCMPEMIICDNIWPHIGRLHTYGVICWQMITICGRTWSLRGFVFAPNFSLACERGIAERSWFLARLYVYMCIWARGKIWVHRFGHHAHWYLGRAKQFRSISDHLCIHCVQFLPPTILGPPH